MGEIHHNMPHLSCAQSVPHSDGRLYPIAQERMTAITPQFGIAKVNPRKAFQLPY
jgi:hypothetical protein